MMNALRDELVELYALSPVPQVHRSDDYVALCTNHEGDRIFDAERSFVEELRVLIDRQLADASSHRQEVELALRLLRNSMFRRCPEKREAFCRLVRKSHGGGWDGAQLEYFDRWAPLVGGGQDYFLSFTNRNPSRPANNPINRDHWHFISDTLGPLGYRADELAVQNLLARCVRNLLREKGLEGFYYPDHEENNAIVIEQLTEECSRAFAFVQLIQRAMFSFDPKGNWCHFEYQAARSSGKQDIVFVQIEDDLAAEDIDLAFGDWVDDWARRGTVKLPWTRRFEPAVIDANFFKIRTSLVQLIREAVERIYREVPS